MPAVPLAHVCPWPGVSELPAMVGRGGRVLFSFGSWFPVLQPSEAPKEEKQTNNTPPTPQNPKTFGSIFSPEMLLGCWLLLCGAERNSG